MYYMFLAYEVIWFRCYSMMLITCITCVLLCEVEYRHLDTISAVLQCRLRFRPEKIVTLKFVFISKILCASNKILPCIRRDFKRHILVSWSRLLPFLYVKWITLIISLFIC